MRNLKLVHILSMAFGVLISLLVIVSLVSANRLNELNERAESVGDNRVPKLVMLDKWMTALLQSSRHMRNMLIYDKQEIPSEIKKLDRVREIRLEAFMFFQKNATSESSRNALNEIDRFRAAFRASEEAFVKQIEEGNFPEARKILIEQSRPIQGRYLELLEGLVKHQSEATRMDIEAAEASYHSGMQIITVLSIIAILAAIALAVVITRHITGLLGGEPAYAAEIAHAIAQGDLTKTVETDAANTGSLLCAMRDMQSSLKQMIANTSRVSNLLVDASHSLATASQQVSQGSDQQSQSAAAMAACVEELTVSLNHVADNARSAHEMADQAGTSSEKAVSLVESTVGEINQVAATVERSAEEVQHLGQQSEQISGIVNVIKDIADQTNLLALNAAIEAARAGEQGRGFAVVADEVRKLAERTTLSTQEIAKMIGDIQRGTEIAVSGMTDGRVQVQQGVDMAERSRQSMLQIQNNASSLLEAVEEISSALREQGAASNDVALNVEKIAQMTEENSEAIRSVSSAAADLEHLSMELKASIGHFKV